MRSLARAPPGPRDRRRRGPARRSPSTAARPIARILARRERPTGRPAGATRRRETERRRLDWTRMEQRRHPRGRADADREVPRFVRRRPPPSSWARSPPSRRCAAPTSSPSQVDQTIFGHARQAGNGPNTGRQVSIHAGVPQEVSAYNVNIACGSGMKATQLGAQQIMLGDSRGRARRRHGEHDPGALPAARHAAGLPARQHRGRRRDVPRRSPRPALRPDHGRDRREPRRPVRHLARGAGRVRARVPAEGRGGRGSARAAEMFPVEVTAGRADRHGRPTTSTSAPADHAWSRSRSSRPSSATAAASRPATPAASPTAPPRWS